MSKPFTTALAAGLLGLGLATLPAAGQQGEGTGEWKLKAVLPAHNHGTHCVAFDPEGKVLASGGFDGVVKLWDPATGKARAVLRGHRQYVSGLAFTDAGKSLVSVSFDGVMKTWDVTRGREASSVPLGAFVASLRFSHDGKTMAICPANYGGPQGRRPPGAVLLDAATRKAKVSLVGHEFDTSHAALSPDGKTVVTVGSGKNPKANPADSFVDLMAPELTFWDAATGKPRKTVPAHTFSFAFSPDGKTLATASYDPKTGKDLIQLWDVAKAEPAGALPGHKGSVYGLAFSPDGTALASSGMDKLVRVWDLKSGKELAALKGHTDMVQSLAFTPAGDLLASGAKDGTVRLWAPPRPLGGSAVEKSPGEKGGR
jgi:WD40 repeat protein